MKYIEWLNIWLNNYIKPSAKNALISVMNNSYARTLPRKSAIKT